MPNSWLENIRLCCEIIQSNQGPRLVNVVSGSQADQTYWQDRLRRTRRDVFRADDKTSIVSSVEETRKGNFLGSLNSWREVQRSLQDQALPPMVLMNMVFGLGKRLSPFTQALVNRKPAFPTPFQSTSQEFYLTTADMAAMSAVLWQQHLESNGFRGVIVKWGDEAVIPGKLWDTDMGRYQEVDGVRFIWRTEPTEDLAREKEWVEYEVETGRMTFQYTRQELESLRGRLSRRGQGRLVGVNLGSLAISYRLIQAAEQVFGADLAEAGKWVDWDPYTWIALSCQDEAEWQAEASLEEQRGKGGISELEQRIPDFYQKINRVRENFREAYGRLPEVRVLDFGEPFWMDWGLHLSMRRSLEALITDTEQGFALRELFGLPHARDQQGNILVRSSIASGCDIHNSMLVDTVITDPGTVMHNGLVVAGRHHKLEMPEGGAALFCAGNEMRFKGSQAIAFYAVGERFALEAGDRLTCLYLTDGAIEMRSNESLVDYEGENYSQPVMGNPISFQEATRRMSLEDSRLVERRWMEKWTGWLG